MLSFYFAGLKKLFSIGKKIFLVIAVYFIVISLFAHFINKDKPRITQDPIQKNRAEIYKVINDPKLNKSTQGKLQIILTRTISCTLIGEGCTNNPSDGETNFKGSLFGFFAKLVATPYTNPPASGIGWAYNGLQNAGFIPKTYAAQGIGFGAISSFSKIWKVLRDVSYTVLVLIIISIGFMIMFRMKLNPQTVITIESSLPKIVLTLIFITFSFPIAGFLIDLMYFLIAIIISVLGPVYSFNPLGIGAQNVTQLQQQYLQAHPFDLFSGLAKNNWIGFSTIFFDLPNALLNVVPFIGTTIKTLGTFATVFWGFPWLKNNYISILEKIFGGIPLDANANAFIAGITLNLGRLGEFIGTPILTVIGLLLAFWLIPTVLIPMVIGLIIFLTLVFIFFRIFFLLFSSYIKILLFIIISPLYLIFEAVPGRSTFSGWIKILVSELISFPAVVAIIILSTIIADTAATGGYIEFPFFHFLGVNQQQFGFLVGMWILFMTPDLIKVIKQTIVPKPGPLESFGLGIFFGGATAGVSGGLGEISKYAGLGYYIQPLGGLIKSLTGGLVDPTHGQGQPRPPVNT